MHPTKKQLTLAGIISLFMFMHCQAMPGDSLFVKPDLFQEETKQVKMIIVMGNGCTFQYLLNEYGKGTLAFGKTSNHSVEIFEFKELPVKSNVKIRDKKRILEFTGLINKMDSMDAVIGSRNWDAWHCILFINGLKRIDVYGMQESKELYRVIQLLNDSKKGKPDPSRCK